MLLLLSSALYCAEPNLSETLKRTADQMQSDINDTGTMAYNLRLKRIRNNTTGARVSGDLNPALLAQCDQLSKGSLDQQLQGINLKLAAITEKVKELNVAAAQTPISPQQMKAVMEYVQKQKEIEQRTAKTEEKYLNFIQEISNEPQKYEKHYLSVNRANDLRAKGEQAVMIAQIVPSKNIVYFGLVTDKSGTRYTTPTFPVQAIDTPEKLQAEMNKLLQGALKRDVQATDYVAFDLSPEMKVVVLSASLDQALYAYQVTEIQDKGRSPLHLIRASNLSMLINGVNLEPYYGGLLDKKPWTAWSKTNKKIDINPEALADTAMFASFYGGQDLTVEGITQRLMTDEFMRKVRGGILESLIQTVNPTESDRLLVELEQARTKGDVQKVLATTKEIRKQQGFTRDQLALMHQLGEFLTHKQNSLSQEWKALEDTREIEIIGSMSKLFPYEETEKMYGKVAQDTQENSARLTAIQQKYQDLLRQVKEAKLEAERLNGERQDLSNQIWALTKNKDPQVQIQIAELEAEEQKKKAKERELDAIVNQLTFLNTSTAKAAIDTSKDPRTIEEARRIIDALEESIAVTSNSTKEAETNAYFAQKYGAQKEEKLNEYRDLEKKEKRLTQLKKKIDKDMESVRDMIAQSVLMSFMPTYEQAQYLLNTVVGQRVPSHEIDRIMSKLFHKPSEKK